MRLYLAGPITERAASEALAATLAHDAQLAGRIPDADRIAQTVGLPVAVVQPIVNSVTDPYVNPVVEWEDSDEVQEVSLLGYQEALGKLVGHPSKRIGDAAVRASVALGLLMQELDRTGELEARRERLLAQLAEVEAELAGVA